MQRARVVKKDIPSDIFEEFLAAGELGVDGEMMGLNPHRDRLCLLQIARENGSCAIVQIEEKEPPALLKQLFENPGIRKIFHYARADVAFLKQRLGINTENVYCTKIASKFARTYSDRHGLKELVKEFTGDNLDKSITSTDWGKAELSDDQLLYAQSDVIYLFHIRRKLQEMLEREGRTELFERSMAFLTHRVELDLRGFGDDIFTH